MPASSLGPCPVPLQTTIKRSSPLALLDLVEKFVSRLAEPLQPVDLSQSELRIGDEPAFCRDLVLNEVIFRPWVANPRPAFPSGIHKVEIVWNQRDEVVDISVPIAVEGSGEEHFRIVVQEHEPHVV